MKQRPLAEGVDGKHLFLWLVFSFFFFVVKHFSHLSLLQRAKRPSSSPSQSSRGRRNSMRPEKQEKCQLKLMW